MDWQRFWSQFQTEIDKTEIGQVAKFSYLKELVISNVRLSIDGLPFSKEGHERAKQILKIKYGEPSEIVHAQVQKLMSLQTIYASQPGRVHKFYEKLATSVQALEKMGKLIQVNGYVRMTIEKLPAIRADIVRMEDNWQKWGFSHLIEALRK